MLEISYVNKSLINLDTFIEIYLFIYFDLTKQKNLHASSSIEERYTLNGGVGTNVYQIMTVVVSGKTLMIDTSSGKPYIKKLYS